MRSTPARICILLAAVLLAAQMPDWKHFLDREGNSYFIDGAGKIRITATDAPVYRPVSSRGIDYYLHYGETLIGEHRYEEALAVLKSICALPAANNRIYVAQVRAREALGRLRRNNGARYDRMNESASLLFYMDGPDTVVINDFMRYSFRGPTGLRVIRRRKRSGPDYRYSGTLFGVDQGAGAKDSYAFLIAVDSEIIGTRFRDVDQAREKWRGYLGFDGLIREPEGRGEDRIVHRFRSGEPPLFAGYEAVFLNGRITHCVRVITSEAGYAGNREAMKRIIEGFALVR
ncbi:MAG: hypothetical protein JW838_01710 [Spirochaetes bacterium]|nr:hypothetical protein [Spirochaetota bacterium]